MKKIHYTIQPVSNVLFLFHFHVGGINASELLQTFNCGIGAVIIVSASDVVSVLKLITYEIPYTVGTVEIQNDGGEEE
jgi:phosphoribosylaminoimidazole (AIR) synthetase